MKTARLLSFFSVILIILSPIITIMGAFSLDSMFFGGTVFLIGALGLFAGMQKMSKAEK